MIIQLLSISWLAVVLSVFALTILGGIWYAGVFAKQYAYSLGQDPSEKTKITTLTYIGPIISNLVIVLCSAILFDALQINSLHQALQLGLFIGIGYLTPMTIIVSINPNFPRPLYYSIVNAPYFIIGSLITCVIIFLFK